MARTNKPDEAYHVPTLNFWFAISSIVLLITCVWMILADYNRSWKQHQREFRELEISRLTAEKVVAQAQLEESDVKAQLEVERNRLQAAQALVDQKRDAITQLDAELLDLRKKLYVAKQNYNFKGADLGKIRYDAEHAYMVYPDDREYLKKVQAEYDAVVADANRLKTEMLDVQDAFDDATAKRSSFLQEKTDAEKAITKLSSSLIKIEKSLDSIGHNFFNDVFRDAPVVDFIRPSITIKQIVLPKLRDDYNFATVQKEDRCETCHLGINKSAYEVYSTLGRFTQPATRAAIEGNLWTKVTEIIDSSGVSADDQEMLLEDFSEKFAHGHAFDGDFLEDADEEQISTFSQWVEQLELDDETQTEKLQTRMQTETVEELRAIKDKTSVYSAHPDRDLYLSSMSPHPMEEIGCSSCHEGRGHAVEFQRVYHTPQNQEQQAEWEEKYGWHAPHYWDHPQLPANRVTASCAKCHGEDVTVRGADDYNEGKRLVQQAGCAGCHKMEGITEKIRKAGPALHRFASKVEDKNFAYDWIWNPQSFRPSSKMPRFFDQSNNGREANEQFYLNTQQEVRGIVAYLYSSAEDFELDPIGAKGDKVRGAKLFQEVGCLGCHSQSAAGNEVNSHGPDLSGIGSKLSEQFIYNWIKDPKRYFADTHMPSMRLTNKEAADIARYLANEKKPNWQPVAIPARNTELQESLLRDLMAGSMRRSTLNDKLKNMSVKDKEIELGRRALLKYGCTGCHSIQGMEDVSPIGAELTTWASKFKTQLDFGHLGPDMMDHTHIAWLGAKLANPRVYDQGKEKTSPFNALLKMPKFNFTESERDKVVTFIMSRTKKHISEELWPVQTKERQSVQEGMWLVEQFNCKGCHYFDGDGGDIARYWSLDATGEAQFQTAANHDGASSWHYLADVEGPVRGHVPPVLLDQGNKTEPSWLFEFLDNPVTLRPMLKMRMPSFDFNDKQRNALIAMFAGIEGHTVGEISSYEPDPELAVIGQKLFENGKCVRCHMFTNYDVPKHKTPKGVVAPNLKLAASRLQHTWTPRWLADPQAIMPGANMPNYFDMDSHYTALDPDGTMLGKDMKKGMDAIRDYLELAGQAYKGNNIKSAGK